MYECSSGGDCSLCENLCSWFQTRCWAHLGSVSSRSSRQTARPLQTLGAGSSSLSGETTLSLNSDKVTKWQSDNQRHVWQSVDQSVVMVNTESQLTLGPVAPAAPASPGTPLKEKRWRDIFHIKTCMLEKSERTAATTRSTTTTKYQSCTFALTKLKK